MPTSVAPSKKSTLATLPSESLAVAVTVKLAGALKTELFAGAVMVTQRGVPIFQADELTEAVAHFRALFGDGYCYVAAIPTYVGGHLAMGWATDNVKLRHASVKTIARRYERAGRFATRYWTPEVHVAAFALPRFIAEKVAKAAERRSGGGGRLSGKPSRSRRRS